MKYFVVLLMAVMISACSSDGEERPEYMDSYSVKALEIPPRLTQLENRQELEIPQPSIKAMQLLDQQEGVEGSVAPLFEGIKLQSQHGVYWLEIQESAEQLWPVLQDFLAHEGIKLYRSEPMLGFMETEWVKEYRSKTEGGFFSNLFNSLSPDVLDKFRIRVERVSGKKLSKVYVSHRGMEKAGFEEDIRWRQRNPEPMLERELLYRLALYAGLNKRQADEIFAEYQPYQARIRILDADAARYEIVGSSDFVWNRLLHTLDRLGVEITQQDQKKGLIQFTVGEIPKELVAEKDEIAESSWLMNMFKGKNADATDSVKLSMSVQASGNVTRMLLQHADGQAITSGLSAQFKDSLVKLLQ